jgi:hypothetical protein
MGLTTLPAASSGGIKLVQRGSAVSAGNVTITAVDINKSFVNVFGTASSGTVAATGTIGAMNGNIAGTAIGNLNGNTARGAWYYQGPRDSNAAANILATSFTGNSANISGGTNNLVSAVVQGFLANSTTLTVSGPCRWEVVEFN